MGEEEIKALERALESPEAWDDWSHRPRKWSVEPCFGGGYKVVEEGGGVGICTVFWFRWTAQKYANLLNAESARLYEERKR